MTNKKSVIFVIALLLAMVLLTACSPAVQPTQKPEDATPAPSASPTVDPDYDAELDYLKAGDVYRIYHWWLQPGNEELEFRDSDTISVYRAETMDTLSDKYGITYQFIAYTGSYWNEVRSSAYAGEAIADGMHGGSVGLVPEHYYYENIPGSCIKAISDYDIDFSDDEYWDTRQQEMYCMFNGKQYAFVMGLVGMKSIEAAKVTFFNYNLIENAGYTAQQLYDMVDKKTWTWQAYKELCASISDPDRNIYGTTYWDLGWQFAISNGGHVISTVDDGNGGTKDVYTGQSEKCIAGWDFLKELYDAGYTTPLNVGTSDADAVTAYRQGNIGLMINHWRRYFENRIFRTVKCGWLPVPMGPDETEYHAQDVLGESFLIFKGGCENTNGLLKAMKMLYRPMLAKSSAENRDLFDSQVAEYCKDKETLDFLHKLEKMTYQDRLVYYDDLMYQYMGIEVTTAILDGSQAPKTYFESVEPVFNQYIKDKLRLD